MSIEARFDSRQGAFRLQLDLQVPADGVTGVFGPSGAGKTSLLRAVAGLDRHAGGYLAIRGEVWQDATRFVPVHHRGVGFVFQEASLFPHLDVRGNLDYARARAAPAAEDKAYEQAVELLEIGPLLDRDTLTLSGGEQQRVAVARALLSRPRLLLMDEPLAALDQRRRQDILRRLEALQNTLSIPVIYVSHALDEVVRLADHLVVMEAGRITASGPSQEVLSRLDGPVAHAEDAEVVLPAVVTAHDEEWQLTRIDLPAGRLLLPRCPVAAGRTVRVRVAARDVSLTLQPQSGTSILNILPAIVDALVEDRPGQVLVRLLAGGQPLLARVTLKSARQLGLEPGLRLYAQVKSVALLF